VNEHITVIDTMNDKKRDVAGVDGRVRRAAALMVDYQTLVGDTVDNVPGVDKVGPKTAAKLLLSTARSTNWWRTPTRSRAGRREPAQGARLAAQGRRLLTIRTDCDLAEHIPGLPALDDIAIGRQEVDALKAFYENYGFKGLVKQLESHDGAARADRENNAEEESRATLALACSTNPPSTTSASRQRRPATWPTTRS
jgi:DNA polymerase-1